MSDIEELNDKAALTVLREYIQSEIELFNIETDIKQNMDTVEAKLYRGEITNAEYERLWDAAIRHRLLERDRLEKRIPMLKSLLQAWDRGENVVIARLEMPD
ncbi:hypothetical protein [Aliirhizobium cellulosilyticum]|uniref:Uncharacterized protein n=1 Tax=Aliirhizobium cellulosilyticum TaxID=393664 RepID=A0A7W6X9D6_9HYPH|nr:hypothetical protein [Rhizobium cellulosilyticum]MBB4347016.1 hypothetical protein [Rhizobium cellulosilyticum]MBB4410590.1 hypothetical protein [Rhizobium cellulosilyticum]MBB4445278.1 hypothetical protein [Rhizobium cellulosilyticum]